MTTQYWLGFILFQSLDISAVIALVSCYLFKCEDIQIQGTALLCVCFHLLLITGIALLIFRAILALLLLIV